MYTLMGRGYDAKRRCAQGLVPRIKILSLVPQLRILIPCQDPGAGLFQISQAHATRRLGTRLSAR
jgi:hypothetical protein